MVEPRCRAPRSAIRRERAQSAWAGFLGLLTLGLAAPAYAKPPDGGAPMPELLSEPSLRTGRRMAPRRSRPTDEETPLRVCSFTEGVCVHAARAAHPAAVLATLAAAEAAARGLRSLRLPPPLPDDDLGGSSAFDLYLVPDEPTLVTSTDLVARAALFDATSAFATLPPPSARAGCALPFSVTASLAEAVLLRLDAGAEEGGLSMTSSYLASLVAPCSLLEIAAVDDVQRAPERPLTAGTTDAPDGHLLFPELLDDTRGTGAPAGVMTALFAVAAQRTPPGSWRWHNTPNLFDGLRAVTKDRGSSLGDLLLEYAVARAFVGSRDDGGHLSDAARFGDMGRVRFEWSVPYSSLPRRLAPLRPIDSTGSTYLWLDLAGAPPGSSLIFVADWELPVLFRWALVKVDARGIEVGRVDVAGIYGDTHVERTVVDLSGLAGIIVVGVSDGSISREYPFAPDEAPFEAHGYAVTLAK